MKGGSFQSLASPRTSVADQGQGTPGCCTRLLGIGVKRQEGEGNLSAVGDSQLQAKVGSTDVTSSALPLAHPLASACFLPLEPLGSRQTWV